MTARVVLSVLIAVLLSGGSTRAQTAAQAPRANRYVDPVNGITLDQAIARTLEHEPSLRAARSEIAVARGMRLQAALRPNPMVSVEHRAETAGADTQTMVAVEWPLELFRRGQRVAVADREVQAVQLAVADRERLLAAEVRVSYGEVLATLRDLATLDELLATTRRQHDLLGSRVAEGATPPLERKLLEVELLRLEADRTLQGGRTEAALMALKRVLGMTGDDSLTLADRFEDLVPRVAEAVGNIADTTQVLEQRVDVREAAARIDVADARIERARAEGRFDVSLFASYMRMNASATQHGLPPMVPGSGSFHYLSAGGMITIPSLNRKQGEVAAARAERIGAVAAHDAARLSAEAELSAARARDEHAREAVRLYAGAAQPLARQNLTVVTQSYELGRVTVFDVLAEQRRYLEVERAYTEALTAAYQARTDLIRALGGVR